MLKQKKLQHLKKEKKYSCLKQVATLKEENFNKILVQVKTNFKEGPFLLVKVENSCHIPRHINCLVIFQQGKQNAPKENVRRGHFFLLFAVYEID